MQIYLDSETNGIIKHPNVKNGVGGWDAAPAVITFSDWKSTKRLENTPLKLKGLDCVCWVYYYYFVYLS